MATAGSSRTQGMYGARDDCMVNADHFCSLFFMASQQSTALAAVGCSIGGYCVVAFYCFPAINLARAARAILLLVARIYLRYRYQVRYDVGKQEGS